jgi:outer membrane protein
MHSYRWIAALIPLMLSTLAAAECREAGPRCVPIGEWDIRLAVGAGMRTNPLVDGSDIPLLVIPQVSYYGERFFIDYLDIGVTLAEGPRYTVNAIVTPGGDGLYFFRSKLNRFVLDGNFSVVSPTTPPRTTWPSRVTRSSKPIEFPSLP